MFIERAITEERKRQVREKIVNDPRQAIINNPQFLNNLLNIVGQRLQIMNTVNSQNVVNQQVNNNVDSYFKQYINSIAKIGPNGKIVGFDPLKIVSPPENILQNWVDFSKTVEEMSMTEQVASQLLSSIQDSIDNKEKQQNLKDKGINEDEQQEGEDEWDFKMRKYKDIPTKSVTVGRKGKVLDSFSQITNCL